MWKDEYRFLIIGIFILTFIGIGLLNFDFITSEKKSLEKKLPDIGDPKYFNKTTLFLYKQIELANYCNTSFDCEYVRGFCPIGCSVYVHKDRAEDIRVLMSKLEPMCMFDCGPKTYPLCKNNKCEVNYYDP